MTQSLWADHDLDVPDNYDENQGALFGASGLQPELHARVALDGELRPVAALLGAAGLPDRWLPSFRTDSAGKWTAAFAIVATVAAVNWAAVALWRTA